MQCSVYAVTYRLKSVRNIILHVNEHGGRNLYVAVSLVTAVNELSKL